MLSPSQTTLSILGGAGKAGRPLVQEALAAGYHVRLLLRDPDAFTLRDTRLTILQGDARDSNAIPELVVGSQALLSTLGHPKGEPLPITAAVTKAVIAAMQAAGLTRYVVVSSLFDTGDEPLDGPTRQAADYMQEHFPLMMNDRRIEYQLLRASRLDWTYVRVPRIMPDASPTGYVVRSGQLPGQQIAGIDLARFLLSALNSSGYRQQAPFVASRL